MSDTLTRPLAKRIHDLTSAPSVPQAITLPQSVIDATVKAFNDGKTHYTNRPGIVPLREWVSSHLKKQYNIDVAPDAITITCGATEARFACVMKLSGGIILAPDGGADIQGAAHLADAKIIDSMQEITEIGLVYLRSNSGQAQVEQLLTIPEVQNSWIVWDTSAGVSDYHPAQDETIASRVVTIGSLSEQIPGWRIGWMAGSEVAGQLRAFKQSMTICSPSISQWAAYGLVDAHENK